MNLTRRSLFFVPVALALTPVLPDINADASTQISTITFGDDPIRRAALDHLMGAVRRTAKDIEYWRNLPGQDYLMDMDRLSKYCYMENGAAWDNINVEDSQALEHAVLQKIDEVAEGVRAKYVGTNKSAQEIATSQCYVIEHLGFGSFPVTTRTDGTPETAEALEALVLPLL